MKYILIGICTVAALLAGLSSCGDAEHITYTDSEYVMFTDTMWVLGIQDSKEIFDIPVASTQACSYDRNFGVEIVGQKTNAVEGKQFHLLSNTVTIKAGEYSANVKVRGEFDAIEAADSVGLTLRLISEDYQKWDIYHTTGNNYNETHIILQKCCPFNLDVFTGYCVLTSSYFNSYMTNVSHLLVKAEKDPDKENSIILKDCFYKGYDLKMTFDPTNPLEPFISYDEQVFAPTSEAFGTLYGNGKIKMYSPTGYQSYYSVCEHYVLQYMTLYVDGMVAGTNNAVGSYMNIYEWISDEEAERIMREGF